MMPPEEPAASEDMIVLGVLCEYSIYRIIRSVLIAYIKADLFPPQMFITLPNYPRTGICETRQTTL